MAALQHCFVKALLSTFLFDTNYYSKESIFLYKLEIKKPAQGRFFHEDYLSTSI